MFCKICGAKVDGQRYCPDCGWQIPEANKANEANASGFNKAFYQNAPITTPVVTTVTPKAIGVPTNTQPNNTTSKKGNKKKILILSVMSVLLIAVAFVICYKLVIQPRSKDKDNKTSENNITSTDIAGNDYGDGSSTSTTGNDKKIKRTIMFYIVGSNLESEGGQATTDINEILSSGYDEDLVNIVIFTGGAKKWNTPSIDAQKNCTFIVKNKQLQLVNSQSVQDMADPNTLSDFLNYAYENYPADRYDLILWNHGGGPLSGFGQDEIYGNIASISDLSTAFKNSPFNSNNKLEIMGYDACIMSSAEIAKAMSPYAEYMIASEESISHLGYDYSFLNKIQDNTSTEELGQYIIDTYYDTDNNSYQSGKSYYTLTLAMLDLSKADAVEDATDRLFAKVVNDFNPSLYNIMSKYSYDTKSFGVDIQADSCFDVIDLYSFADKIKKQYPAEAKNLCDSISDMTVYFATNEPKEAFGVTIYHPVKNIVAVPTFLNRYSSLNFSANYYEYLKDYCGYLTSPSPVSVDWNSVDLYAQKNADGTFSLPLSADYADEVVDISFIISRSDYDNPDMLTFVGLSKEITYSNETMNAVFDGNVIYLRNDTVGTNNEIMFYEQESTSDYSRFLIPAALYNDANDDKPLFCYYVLETSAAHPEGQLIAVYPLAEFIDSNGTVPYPERLKIDPTDYKYVAFGNLSHGYTGFEDLTTFNANDWSDLKYNFSFHLTTDSLSTILGGLKNDCSYYGMFVITDSQGNRHSSNLVKIQ